MKLAIITPWPPQQSGIAEYSLSLASLLSKKAEVCILTNAENPEPLNDVLVVQLKSDLIPNLQEYDAVIYQVGNNAQYHGFMLPILKKNPGIIHLHDMVLHHLVAELTIGENKLSAYFDIIKMCYGEKISCQINSLFDKGICLWETEYVNKIPLFENIIKYANGLFLHSKYAAEKIQTRFPYLPLKIIPQIYQGFTLSTPKELKDEVSFGIFGHIIPQKKIPLSINAVYKLAKKQTNLKFKLTIVGNHNDEIANMLDALDLSIKNFSYDYVISPNTQKFNALLQSMDAVIALRNPTMGETSAIVSKSLQLGIPCFVSNTGWYAEIPGQIFKIDTTREAESLDTVLNDFINNKSLYLNEAQKLALNEYDTSSFANEYMAFIDEEIRLSNFNMENFIASQVLKSLECSTELEEIVESSINKICENV